MIFLSTSLHSPWWWTIKYFAIEAQPCIYFKRFERCILFLTTCIFRKQANIIPKPTKQVLQLLLLWLIQMVYLTFLCSLNRFHFWRFMAIAFYLIDLICSFPQEGKLNTCLPSRKPSKPKAMPMGCYSHSV